MAGYLSSRVWARRSSTACEIAWLMEDDEDSDKDDEEMLTIEYAAAASRVVTSLDHAWLVQTPSSQGIFGGCEGDLEHDATKFLITQLNRG